MIFHQMEVVVINKSDQPLEGARVTAKPETQGVPVEAAYDEDRKVYHFDNLSMGFHKVSVEHPSYVTQHKRVQVHPKPTREIFILFEDHVSYTFRGGTRVPYESHPEVLGVFLSQRDDVPLAGLRESFSSLSVESPQLEEAHALASNLEGGSTPSDVKIPRTLIVRRSLESPLRESSLKGLRDSSFVEAAGPIFHRTEHSLSIFTNRMLVRFRPEVTRAERDEILNGAELRLVEEMAFTPNLVLVEADPSLGERINQKAEQLSLLDSVIYAEPSLHEDPAQDIVPGDFLWRDCWDRKRVKTEQAWDLLNAISPDIKFGSPDIIIAVVDNGIESDGLEPLNGDFRGRVSNRKRKTLKLFDFRNLVPNHMQTAGNNAGNHSAHGMSCAGVALAKVDNKTGVAGSAPNARLLGLIFPKTDEEKLRMFQWAAGLPVKTKPPGFPKRLKKGADIFTCSIGLGEGSPTPGIAKDILDYLTSRGRNGKGCMLIFSAGNKESPIRIQRSYGYGDKSFSCAASTLQFDPTLQDVKEVRATYSNFGDIDWCAPSSSGLNDGIVHAPPHSHGVLTTSVPGSGNMPSFAEFETTLKNNTASSCIDGALIKVADVGSLTNGAFILVGSPGTNNSEPSFITNPPNVSNNEIAVQTLARCHQAGDSVISGPNNHENNFGGTSASTPLSAGICALVLSANPNLTWVEARDILYKTAEKIDPDNKDPIAEWRDINLERISKSGLPPHFSDGFGYGRLDAARAVEAARAYTFTRDLMIRKSLNDTGLGPDLKLAFGESPDIWVRDVDPAAEPDSNKHNLSAAFDKPGPHQTPSRGKDQWVYARVKNIGTEASLDAWVRFYVALTKGNQLRHPEDWEPKNGIGNLTSFVWRPGVYFIGEVGITKIPPGTDYTVPITWPKGLIPPTSSAEAGLTSFLLVEVLPLDGRDADQNNNLAQRTIEIND